MIDQIYTNKKQIIKKLLILFFISHGVVILGIFLHLFSLIDFNNPVLVTILYLILDILSFICCIYVIKCKDDSTYFEKSWIRITLSEWAFFILLVVSILIVNFLVIKVMQTFGFSVEKTSAKTTSLWFICFLIVDGSIVGPIAEELFWRGYVQWNLRKIFGPKTALIGQALVFSLLHIIGGVIYAASAFSKGIIFGIWREKRRTLLPIILAHIIVNTLYFSRYWYALFISK